MKVGAFRRNKTGCYWYRVKRTQDILKKAGFETVTININEDVDDDIDMYALYGSQPFSMRKVLDSFKQEKKKIVYDIDDALTLLDESNPFYYDIMASVPSFTELINSADELTTSTEEMKRYLGTKTDKNITVIPNTYDPNDWTFERPKREGLRIGFAGSPTHIGDLLLVLPAIRNLQKKYDFTFILFGFSKYNTYREWYQAERFAAQGKRLEDLLAFDKIMAEIKFEFVPFVDYELYPTVLTNLALDIGLCPLRDTPFNRCRSACKAMEYTLSGAVSLASDVTPYRNEASSILVSEGNWEDALELLIKNPDVIKSTHEASLNWTKENRQMDSQIEPLKKVYELPMR